MKIYLRVLSIFYFAGALLHLADIFDLRLQLSQMSTIWKVWILYLFLWDSAASVGLWFQKGWGQAIFVLVAVSQLIAYLGFPRIFGSQIELITFHVATLTIYGVVLFASQRPRSQS